MPATDQSAADTETLEDALEVARAEGMDTAADFIFDKLAEALGVTEYCPCDGTETWDGDVAGTVYVILRAAGVLNDENRVATHAELDRLRTALARAAAEG